MDILERNKFTWKYWKIRRDDSKDVREEYDSVNDLKKIIKATLDNTNWRLMSEGVHYRLGVLTGRLKAYEQEEDLRRIVKGKS